MRRRPMTAEMIASHMGLDRDRVIDILIEEGDPTLVKNVRKGGFPTKRERNAAIVRDRANRMNRDDIAKKYGVLPSVVSYVINKYAPPSVKRINNSHKPLPKEEIFADRRDGMTMADISKKYKKHDSVIRKLLKSPSTPPDIRYMDLRYSPLAKNRHEILQHFADGFSVEQLTGIYNMSSKQIQNVLEGVPGARDSQGVWRIRSMKQLMNANRRLWALKDAEQEILDLRKAKAEMEEKIR